MKKAVPDKSSDTFGWYERDIGERPRNSDQVVYSPTEQSIKLSIRILELFPGENSPARMLGYCVTISHTDIKPVYMIEQFRSREKGNPKSEIRSVFIETRLFRKLFLHTSAYFGKFS